MAASDGRISFEDILNFRDVGVHINHLVGKSVLQPGQLFRSARPDAATPDDQRRLEHDLHIKTIIDLRTPTEHIEQARKAAATMPSAPAIAPKDPSRPFRIPSIEYKDVNFNGKGYSNALIRKLSYWQTAKLFTLYSVGYRKEAISVLGTNVMAERGLAGLAEDSLEHCRKEVKEAFDVLCDTGSYPVLVHCTQGKDRTGLIVLLALMLCDVSVEAIAADYTLSERELGPEREEKLAEIRSIGLPDSFADCPAGWTGKVSQYMDKECGGITTYLESCGVSLDQQKRLRMLLLAI